MTGGVTKGRRSRTDGGRGGRKEKYVGRQRQMMNKDRRVREGCTDGGMGA